MKQELILWEGGGAFGNTADASIITDKDGNRKIPIFIPTSGSLSNGDHAQFHPELGDLKITWQQGNGYDDVSVEEVVEEDDVLVLSTILEGNYMKLKPLLIKRGLKEALSSLHEKVDCYHCRCTHYCDSNAYWKEYNS